MLRMPNFLSKIWESFDDLENRKQITKKVLSPVASYIEGYLKPYFLSLLLLLIVLISLLLYNTRLLYKISKQN